MKNFTCQACGNCCKWEGIVRATEQEMADAAKLLNITLDQFIQKYTRLSEDRRSLIFEDNEAGACIFLNDDNKCMIYPARPWQCRTFPHEWDVCEDLQKFCHGHQIAKVKNQIQDQFLVHVFGHPNKPLDVNQFPGDAQILNCQNICLMLSKLNIPFIYYGCADSIIPNGGAFESIGKPTGNWAYQNAWHNTYTKRLGKALAKHAILDDESPELILALYGAAHAEVDAMQLPVIEAMLGYDHGWATYKVFPSYAHQHTIYAKQPELAYQTKFFDTVIPHFLDENNFITSENPKDYLLYLGRNAPDKGIQIARDAAKAAGRELKEVFSGCYGEEKAKLIANAYAVMMPTLYVEPFGYVAIEAQLSGTPIITTDWGAFAETVIHGKTGFRCRTQAEFVAAINKAKELDRHYIRQSAVNRFSMDKIAPKYHQYFHFVWNVHKNGGYYANAAFRDISFYE
ncbi:MAG: glycosyltransferase [Lentisphaerae bacterium]|jgi:glycosyltransferase involved in cell wall biosynthesis|nr:glycosyltransferase [Lentisphaerota bacterium]